MLFGIAYLTKLQLQLQVVTVKKARCALLWVRGPLSCEVMADMKKVYDDLIIINLYIWAKVTDRSRILAHFGRLTDLL